MEIEKVIRTNMTKVDYFGEKFYVPDWVNFIATDKLGEVTGHEEKPEAGIGNFFSSRHCVLHAYIRFKDHENVWKESVLNVKTPFAYGSARLLKYKTVAYYGLSLTVPENTNYIAIDCDGTITCFEDEPSQGLVSWFALTDRITVGKVKLVTEDGWKHSLRKV